MSLKIMLVHDDNTLFHCLNTYTAATKDVELVKADFTVKQSLEDIRTLQPHVLIVSYELRDGALRLLRELKAMGLEKSPYILMTAGINIIDPESLKEFGVSHLIVEDGKYTATSILNYLTDLNKSDYLEEGWFDAKHFVREKRKSLALTFFLLLTCAASTFSFLYMLFSDFPGFLEEMEDAASNHSFYEFLFFPFLLMVPLGLTILFSFCLAREIKALRLVKFEKTAPVLIEPSAEDRDWRKVKFKYGMPIFDVFMTFYVCALTFASLSELTGYFSHAFTLNRESAFYLLISATGVFGFGLMIRFLVREVKFQKCDINRDRELKELYDGYCRDAGL